MKSVYICSLIFIIDMIQLLLNAELLTLLRIPYLVCKKKCNSVDNKEQILLNTCILSSSLCQDEA